MKNIIVWTLLVLSDTTAQLLMKKGAVEAASANWLPNLFILCGYGFYILSFSLWMQLLKDTRLFIALSGSSIVYVTIAFGSYLLLGERLNGQIMFGTVLIAAGVFLLRWGRERSSAP